MKCYYCDKEACSKIVISSAYSELYTIYACKEHFDLHLENSHPNKSIWLKDNKEELLKLKNNIKLANK